MITRILVAVSGTAVGPAKLTQTLDLAKRHKAEITALSVIDVERLRHVGPVPIGAGHHAEHWREQRIEEARAAAEQRIAEMADLARQAGLKVHPLRVEGDPLDVLIRAWRYQDLCVLGARSWFEHGVVPQPADALLKVVAAGVRPLLTVTDATHTVHKALVAYNGSLESAKAMKQFAQMRIWPGIALHIVCVNGTKTGEPAERVLEDAAAYCRGQGFGCTAAQLDGQPSEVLLRHAHEVQADLIVLGSSFRKVLTLQRFGTNALTLLQTSDLPLFLSH